VEPQAIITPLARETAERHGIAFVESVPKSPKSVVPTPQHQVVEPMPAPTPLTRPSSEAPGTCAESCAHGVVALGADHGGFALKEILQVFLAREAGCRVLDLGTFGAEAVDYPDFAHKVAGAVARGEACRGIIIDGVGVGSCMVANKHAGVRAVATHGILEVVNAREHNDANVLCLGGKMIGDLLARALVSVFLTTKFAGGRHARRVEKIDLSLAPKGVGGCTSHA
jgi:ribose 5-phosphate isomerase B